MQQNKDTLTYKIPNVMTDASAKLNHKLLYDKETESNMPHIV